MFNWNSPHSGQNDIILYIYKMIMKQSSSVSKKREPNTGEYKESLLLELLSL